MAFAILLITHIKSDNLRRLFHTSIFALSLIHIYFSISLKCTHKVMTKKEIRAESIRFDNVHLRTSKEFKKKIKREIELERVENSKVKNGCNRGYKLSEDEKNG